MSEGGALEEDGHVHEEWNGPVVGCCDGGEQDFGACGAAVVLQLGDGEVPGARDEEQGVHDAEGEHEGLDAAALMVTWGQSRRK